jgi:hypothetical protein
MPALPKPPINTMTDFVVFCFVSIVVIILLVATVGLFVNTLTDPEGDRSALTNALSDIVTTLIGALVGFIAGKGSGKSEAHEEQNQRELLEKQRLLDQEERIKARGGKLG